MKLDEIPFEIKEKKKKKYTPKRTYDVNVSKNGNGGENGSHVVRFGFINKAAKAINEYAGYNFIKVSKMVNDRIYFKLFNSKEDIKTHELKPNSKKRSGFYTTITPSLEDEGIYRSQWYGTYPLKKDDECGLYYIDREDRECQKTNRIS